MRFRDCGDQNSLSILAQAEGVQPEKTIVAWSLQLNFPLILIVCPEIFNRRRRIKEKNLQMFPKQMYIIQKNVPL